MKHRLIWIMIGIVLLTGLFAPVGVFADGDHPITLTVTCDPAPELEGEGEIPELLFTIRNESDADYTLTNAKLTGGFEDREMLLDESITVLAGATKEFVLNNVPVSDEQLGREILYTLTWEEHREIVDEETGETTFLTHNCEAVTSIQIERFVVPELAVAASSNAARVRVGEKFTVQYTIRNDTQFDITGLKLYDPEQSMQTIEIPSDELIAGEKYVIPVEYEMGSTNLTFEPRIEYISRRREMVSRAPERITVESVLVDLSISTQAYPPTGEGTTFAVTVKNAGNQTVTGIQVYDEINTPVDSPFDLPPDQTKVVMYTVRPAVSSEHIRSVRFHATAVDCLNSKFTVSDPNSFDVVPYISSDDVRIGLGVVLQSPYYNESGKLCASIQFEMRNKGDVKIYHAVLNELTLFGEVIRYDELRPGETFYTQIYQLDGVKELRFRLDAVDPAGQSCSSDTIRLDLSGLKELADRKNDPVYVYTTNPYMQDLDAKYSGILRTATVIGLCVAAMCAVICMILFAVEIKLRRKLPPEFEEDMERAMRSTKRRTEKQLFSDAPTEQFGYTAPIKLRNYGDLTEEEAKERRAAYAKGLEENLRKTGDRAADHNPRSIAASSQKGKETLNGNASASPIGRPVPAHSPTDETMAFRRPEAPRTADETAAFRRPEAPRPADETTTFSRPVREHRTDETMTFRRPASVRFDDDVSIVIDPAPIPVIPSVHAAMPVTFSEPQLAEEPEPVIESEPVTVSDSFIEREPDPLFDSEPVVETDPESVPDLETGTDIEPEIVPETVTEHEPSAEPVSAVKAETDPTPESESVSDAETDKATESESVIEIESETAEESEPVAEADPEQIIGSETEPCNESEAETEPVEGIEPETVTESEPAFEPEQEPVLTRGTVPVIEPESEPFVERELPRKPKFDTDEIGPRMISVRNSPARRAVVLHTVKRMND